MRLRLTGWIRAAGWVCVLLLAACAGPQPPDGFAEDPRGWDEFFVPSTEWRLEADWDDIDAAVDVAVYKVEMGVVSKNEGPGWGGVGGDPARRVFVLKTVRDEPAWLMVTRATVRTEDGGLRTEQASASPSQKPEQLLMQAKVGRFGDAERERKLLRAVGNRLEELKGRGWYPGD